MRRLYSNFAAGTPGAGLLVLRMAAGIALTAHLAVHLDFGSTFELVVDAIAAGVATLLIIGLWTPIVGALAAVDAFRIAWTFPVDQPFWLAVGAIAAALTLLGPGKWSVDFRLFGSKRLDFGDEP